MSKIGIVLNGRAGSAQGEECRKNIEKALETHGLHAAISVAQDDRVPEVARQYVKEGCDLIVAGGGDGTLGAVAGQLLGSSAIMGVLPLGTLNHFARDAGIPPDLDQAIEL